jgi:hypothetical protein
MMTYDTYSHLQLMLHRMQRVLSCAGNRTSTRLNKGKVHGTPRQTHANGRHRAIGLEGNFSHGCMYGMESRYMESLDLSYR